MADGNSGEPGGAGNGEGGMLVADRVERALREEIERLRGVPGAKLAHQEVVFTVCLSILLSELTT